MYRFKLQSRFSGKESWDICTPTPYKFKKKNSKKIYNNKKISIISKCIFSVDNTKGLIEIVCVLENHPDPVLMLSAFLPTGNTVTSNTTQISSELLLIAPRSTQLWRVIWYPANSNEAKGLKARFYVLSVLNQSATVN